VNKTEPEQIRLQRFTGSRKIFHATVVLLCTVIAFAQAKTHEATTFRPQPHNFRQFLQLSLEKWSDGPVRSELQLRNEYVAASRSNDTIRRINAGALTGFHYLRNRRTNEALDFSLRAYHDAKSTGNRQLIINTTLQVAYVQSAIGAYQKSNEVLAELLRELRESMDPETNGLVYALMAENFARLDIAANSTELFRRAAKSFLKANKPELAACCHLALGENQLRMNEYKQAEESFRSALSFTSANSFPLHALAYRDMGLIEFKKRSFDKAIRYFLHSDSLENDALVRKLLKDCYMQLFTYHSYKREFEKADHFHELYRAQKDLLNQVRLSVNEIERGEVLRMLELNGDADLQENIRDRQLELSRMIDRRDLDLQQKELLLEEKTQEADSLAVQNARHERDIARQQTQLTRQQNTRNMLIAFSIVALMFVILFYNRYALKKKTGESLAKSNAELQVTLEQLRNAQDQLVHSEKMAGLGKLTAGIAHEMRNPLNFIRNFSESGSELLDEYKITPDEMQRAQIITELSDSLSRIRHHAMRADQIVSSMLQHSRTGGSKELADINSLLQDSVQLAFQSMRASNASFHCRIEENLETLPEIEVQSQQLSRVFLNIAGNAFYAMHEKQLKVSDGYDPVLSVVSAIDSGKIRISIADNGPGIPKDNLLKVFEPFFTTKPTGKGTGLGLSISYDIIRQHGGELKVQSEPDKGTSFIITLPVSIPNEPPAT
jgi:signal transduction histidine kinase